MNKYLIVLLTSSDVDILILCIESALNQIYNNYDVYVVVNTTKEGYFERVKERCEPYNIAKIVQTSSNGKPGKGHNSVLTLFRNESYDYLIMCDGDDFLYPTALTRIEHLLESHDYDAIALCGRSSSLSVRSNDCKESGSLTSKQMVYTWNCQVSIDRLFFQNISSDYNHTLATPCRLLVTKKSFAMQEENLFDERMQIYDDYYMFLSLYQYCIHQKYKIGFLCDPYLYLYNFTNPNSVSHKKDSSDHQDQIYYNSYDISELDVSKIKVNCHWNLDQDEMIHIRSFERKIQKDYLQYYNEHFPIDINNNDSILFVDNGTDWDYSTIQKRSLRGTENAIYQISDALSSLKNKTIVVLTKSGTHKKINPYFEFNHINTRSHYTFQIAIHQGIFLNDPLFYNKKNMIYIQHDVNVDCIQTNFSKLKEFDTYVHKYIFVSEWQKKRFIDHYHLREDKCTVIQNAVSPALHLPSHHDKKVQSLIFVSSPYRGLLPLLSLFDRLIVAYPDLRLKVFSSFHIENSSTRNYVPIDESYMNNIYQSSYDMRYKNIYNYMIKHDNIDFYGNVPQHILFQHMKVSMIMLYPCTFAETCCTSVLEAMANRCFVISSKIGALRETTNNMAYLYDPCLKSPSSVYETVINPICIKNISNTYQENVVNKCKELLDSYYSNEKQSYLDLQQSYIMSSCLWKHKMEQIKRYL